MKIDLHKRYQTKNCFEVKNLHIDSYKSKNFPIRGIVIDPYASDASKREVEHSWTLEGRWSQRETSFLDLVEAPEPM